MEMYVGQQFRAPENYEPPLTTSTQQVHEVLTLSIVSQDVLDLEVPRGDQEEISGKRKSFCKFLGVIFFISVRLFFTLQSLQQKNASSELMK